MDAFLNHAAYPHRNQPTGLRRLHYCTHLRHIRAYPVNDPLFLGNRHSSEGRECIRGRAWALDLASQEISFAEEAYT
jgi:hypothetical protein